MSDPGFRFDGILVQGNWQWVKEENPTGVLNGGFSLRSQKFLCAPREIGLPYHFDDNTIRQKEDLQLCLFMRPELEAHGVKFSPIEIAKKFAIEHFYQHEDYIDFKNIFGVHCASNLQLIDRTKVSYAGYLDLGRNGPGKLIRALRTLGYEVVFK